MTLRPPMANPASDEESVQILWKNPTLAAQEFGGLRHHGMTPEFFAALDFVKAFANTIQASPQSRWLLLADEFDGKSTLAASIRNELVRIGISASLLDGTKPISFGKDFPSKAPALVIDNLPSALDQRDKAARKIATYSGKIILLTRSAYRNERCLEAFVHRHLLSSIDDRPLDKLCRLIGVINEKISSQTGDELVKLETLLSYLPSQTLYKFCRLNWGQRLRAIEELAGLILDRIETTRLSGMTTQVDPTQLFFDLVSWQQINLNPRNSSTQRRLFVEGSTDRDLLLLAVRLNTLEPKFDWLSGLDIHVMDGTAQVNKIIREQNPHPEHDLFLLDLDKDGRLAADKLTKNGLAYQFLPEMFARYPNEANGSLEIEDLLSVYCIDRFYSASVGLLPETEFLYYKNGPIRRLQVAGSDKDALVEWLAHNASFEDLERLLYLLAEIRHKLGLDLPVGLTLSEWQARLCGPTHKTSLLGMRSLPWWPPPSTQKSEKADEGSE